MTVRPTHSYPIIIEEEAIGYLVVDEDRRLLESGLLYDHPIVERLNPTGFEVWRVDPESVDDNSIRLQFKIKSDLGDAVSEEIHLK